MTTVLPEGTVTVVFTDVEASTALRSALGDARASDLLEAHAATIRDLADRHDGTEVKALGDGFMLVFTSTRRALEFAVAAHRDLARKDLGPPDRPLRVRIGMHTGEVEARDGDLFGQAVHVAARVQAVARGGESLATDLVRALAGNVEGIAWEDRGEHELKGFDTPWTLHALTSAGPPSRDRPRPLVGRMRERKHLHRRLDDLAAGRGCLVFIEGAAGIGKTRLAEDLQQEATARGHRVLVARCSERQLSSPFGPWVDLLRAGIHDTDPDTLRNALGDAAGEIARVLPELRTMFPDIPLPMQLPADQEREFVLHSVMEFLARAAVDRPLVLVVDDLQWADESTLALIEHASPHLATHAVLVVGASRPTDGPAARLAADLVTHGLADHLRLAPLDRAEVADLLTAHAGSAAPSPVVASLHDRTGGNPYFLEELFTHLVDQRAVLDEDGTWVEDADLAASGLPDSIRLVLRDRLGRLAAEARPILAAAATLGRSSPLAHVGRLAGTAPGGLVESLDAAEQAGLLRTEPDPAGHTIVMFTHDLVRDAVLDELTHVRRQHLHQQAAEVLLEAVGDDRTRAAEIADHLLAAGDLADPDVTARTLVAAGEAALAAAAFADAQLAFERAVASGAGGNRQQADARRGIGYALRSTKGWEASRSHLMEALGIYEQVGDAGAIGELCVELSFELAWGYRVGEAFEVVDRGLAALTSLGADGSLDALQLAAGRSALLALAGDTAGAEDGIDEVLARLDGVADPLVRASTLRSIATASLQMVRMDTALAAQEEAVDLLRQQDDRWQLAEALGWLSVMRCATGLADGVPDLLDEQAALADRLGHASARMLLLRGRRYEAMVAGRLEEAQRLLAEDHQLCLDHDMPWADQALAMQAALAAVRGDHDRAEAWSLEAMRGEIGGAWAGPTVGLRATVLSLRGDAEGLRSLLKDHADLVDPYGPMTIGRASVHPPVVLALARVGELGAAAERYDVVRRLRDEHGTVLDLFALVPVDLAVAVAASCAGRGDEVGERLAAVRRFGETFEARMARAEVDAWESWLLRQAGTDEARADQLLRNAVDAYRRMGAHGLADGLVAADVPNGH